MSQITALHDPAGLIFLTRPRRRTISNANGSWACDYYDDMIHLLDFGAPNAETLADLVLAFFGYWAREHDYGRGVISIRTGQLLTKQHKARR